MRDITTSTSSPSVQTPTPAHRQLDRWLPATCALCLLVACGAGGDPPELEGGEERVQLELEAVRETQGSGPEVLAGAWPQLFGPARTAEASGATLPADPGGRELWRTPLGSGYSSLTVVDSVLYTLVSDHESDFAVAFSTADGGQLWRTRLGPTYEGHGGSEDGPTSTPTVAGEALYAVSPHGRLVALRRADGGIVWQRDLVADFGAVAPDWSFATAPLVDGERLIVQVGAVGENNLVAFDRASGEVIWSVTRQTRLGYSSPVLARLAGHRQVVVAGESEIYAVRPEDGALLWSHPSELRDKLVPLVLPGSRLFVPSWNEGLLLSVYRDGRHLAARQLWTTTRLKGSYSPTVHLNGNLFGFNGSILTCLDAQSGEVRWRRRAFEGSLILVDGRLLIWGEGALRIAKAQPSGYTETLHLPLTEQPRRTVIPPSYADGTVYLRHPEAIVAVALTAEPNAGGEEGAP